jgi:antitoxin (DNA-binding transcriptional repressor) of toxin-antitoxin stability system
LEQKVPFAGQAVARLVGLPANTTARDVEITQDSQDAVFEIITTAKSPLGTHKNVFCQVTLTRDGEPITHLIAQGSVLRIDPPRPKPAGDNQPVAQAKPE